jgi:hypothetical protein
MEEIATFHLESSSFADDLNMTFDISPKNQKIIDINKAGKNNEGFCFLFPTFVSGM